MNVPRARFMSGRILDPVFLSMIGAVILAVGTSIAVRAMAGAKNAPAAENAPQSTVTPAPTMDNSEK